MSWADYTVPTTMIDTGGGVERPVRGLSLDDLNYLVTRHISPIMEVTTMFLKAQKDIVATSNLSDFLLMASRLFPELTSEVIAVVTDTPELAQKRLPVGLQLKVLQSAFKLTIEDIGGMGNLTALLQNTIREAKTNAPEGVRAKLEAILSSSSTTASEKT